MPAETNRETSRGVFHQRHSFKAMGGPCSIQLYGSSDQHVNEVMAMAEQEVRRLEQKYSRYRDDSVISAINRAAASGRAYRVDEETGGILDYAQTLWQESGGLFDITSGLYRSVWDFNSGKLPDEKLLAQVCSRVGWDKANWDGACIGFSLPGMELDFGGIVKEMAADRVANICLENGIAHGLVELAGDIRAIGPHPDGSPWQVGIRNPRQPEHAVATISLFNGGLASSGDYERYMEVDGHRYCHILNPKTGWPVDHYASVSVVADQCIVAGSMATIAMLKQAQGESWLEAQNLACLCIDQTGKASGRIASDYYVASYADSLQ